MDEIDKKCEVEEDAGDLVCKVCDATQTDDDPVDGHQLQVAREQGMDEGRPCQKHHWRNRTHLICGYCMIVKDKTEPEMSLPAYYTHTKDEKVKNEKLHYKDQIIEKKKAGVKRITDKVWNDFPGPVEKVTAANHIDLDIHVGEMGTGGQSAELQILRRRRV